MAALAGDTASGAGLALALLGGVVALHAKGSALDSPHAELSGDGLGLGQPVHRLEANGVATRLPGLELGLVAFAAAFFEPGRNTTINASAIANVAIDSNKKLIPSYKSVMPNVNRWIPEGSSPTVANIKPNSAIMAALSTCPLPENAVMAVNPNSINAK